MNSIDPGARGRARSRIWAAALALLALSAVTFAAGGGSASATGAATASRAKARVGIRGFAYRPATIRVRPGTTVVFSNSSREAHTATGRAFDTGRIRPGRAAAVRFARRGTFPYRCTLHPFMRGKIVVG